MLLGKPWCEDTRTVDGSTREKWAHPVGWGALVEGVL